MRFEGKAIVLGDDINTDLLAPSRWLSSGPDVLKLHSMEAVRPNLYKDVTPGDILIGGRNFGCGSHREQASTILKVFGFSVVVAESIARLYFRNCISLGVPAVVMPGVTQAVKEGDRVQVQIDELSATLTNLTSRTTLKGAPLPALAMDLLVKGGFMELMKAGSPGVVRL